MINWYPAMTWLRNELPTAWSMVAVMFALILLKKPPVEVVGSGWFWAHVPMPAISKSRHQSAVYFKISRWSELQSWAETNVGSNEIVQVSFDRASDITLKCLCLSYFPRTYSPSHQNKAPAVSLLLHRQRHCDLQPPCWGGLFWLDKRDLVRNRFRCRITLGCCVSNSLNNRWDAGWEEGMKGSFSKSQYRFEISKTIKPAWTWARWSTMIHTCTHTCTHTLSYYLRASTFCTDKFAPSPPLLHTA